ncbi:MAG TPA: hypothetical protein VFP56_03310 [Candidatus Limnocylindrales bacterium]|nr:hypothetical protein [Candidatus Limnocylindrales bacterium]
MAEFERVPLRPRNDRSWLSRLGVAVALFVGVAILKPWDMVRTAGSGDATPLPTFYVSPTERTGARPYNPVLFGLREPDPGWELWPAGYVVRFGLAGPVRVDGSSETAAPAGSAGPATGSPATEGPVATSSPSTEGPAAVATPGVEPPAIEGLIDLGTADHLLALGINTPLDVRLESVELSRVEDERVTPVPIVRLPTLWESSHFTVIAPEDPVERGQAAPWEPGLYRLELTPTFGDVRIVDFQVYPPLAGSPNPTDPTKELRPPFR